MGAGDGKTLHRTPAAGALDDALADALGKHGRAACRRARQRRVDMAPMAAASAGYRPRR